MNDQPRNSIKRSHLLTAKELVKNLREIEIDNMIKERVEGKKGRPSVINEWNLKALQLELEE